MSRKPVTLGTDASLKDAIGVMVEKKVGSIYIVDANDALLGVFTERELLQYLVTSQKDSKDIEVGEAMSHNVIPISQETSIQEAARTMIVSKGRLAVTKDNAIIGALTASDIVRAFSTFPENRSISGIVTQKVKTLDIGNTVFDAVRLMHEKRIGSVVVTKDGRPSGIFTERDLLRILETNKRIIDIRLEEVASRPLVTANVGVTAREAASIMKSNRIKRLPLLKGDNLEAIVTARDLVETYVSTGLPIAKTGGRQ